MAYTKDPLIMSRLTAWHLYLYSNAFEIIYSLLTSQTDGCDGIHEIINI